MAKNDFSFDIQGLDELDKTLQKMIKSVDPEKVEPILEKNADIITQAVESKAPRGETGNLKRAVKTKKLGRMFGNPAPSISTVDRKIAPHAHLVEYGHGGDQPAPAHPFFRPAVDEKQNIVFENVLDEIGDLIDGGMK